MKKIVISISILILLLAGIIFLRAEQDPPYTNSWTKAICDEKKYCQDYEIFCKGKELVGISPITGAAIQFSENWEDPRDEETRNRVC